MMLFQGEGWICELRIHNPYSLKIFYFSLCEKTFGTTEYFIAFRATIY